MNEAPPFAGQGLLQLVLPAGSEVLQSHPLSSARGLKRRTHLSGPRRATRRTSVPCTRTSTGQVPQDSLLRFLTQVRDSCGCSPPVTDGMPRDGANESGFVRAIPRSCASCRTSPNLRRAHIALADLVLRVGDTFGKMGSRSWRSSGCPV